MNKFPNNVRQAIDALNRYYGRYLSAKDYQQYKQSKAAQAGT